MLPRSPPPPTPGKPAHNLLFLQRYYLNANASIKTPTTISYFMMMILYSEKRQGAKSNYARG